MRQDTDEHSFDSRAVAIRSALILGGMTAASGLIALLIIHFFS